MEMDSVRGHFPSLALTDNGHRRYYFDNPAGTQVPRAVIDGMSDCMTRANANVGGYFASSRFVGEIVDGARQCMADLLNAPAADEIVFGPNMTALTLHLSRSVGRYLGPGDEIILSRMDHDANIEPWRLIARDHGLVIRWLPFDTGSYEFDMGAFTRLLNAKTRLVCVGAASNLTGTINDIETICSLAREAGAWTFIDGVHAVPHVLTDVQKIGCDFFACSAYKFFGPHQGILWGHREVLESLEPYRLRPAPDRLPCSFEPGTQSHEGMAGTSAAVEYLAGLGASAGTDRRLRLVSAYRRIVEHERCLAEHLVDGLQAIAGVEIRGISQPGAMTRRVPTVSFTHSRQSPTEIAERLAARNIFVWSGHNYALEVVRALGIEESGGVVRIGAVHYNTLDEVDTLLNALEDVLG